MSWQKVDIRLVVKEPPFYRMEGLHLGYYIMSI